MNTAFILWKSQDKPALSEVFICELNMYASHHLSPRPGDYRSSIQYNVAISGTDHRPPPYEQVNDYMSEFVAKLNSFGATEIPSRVAAYALWRLNWIHPFAQGNGRTSRALSYFIMCQRYDLWFPGTLVPELIRANHSEYCGLLRDADRTVDSSNMADLEPIRLFLERLLEEQINSVQRAAPNDVTG
jgi:Fic family protein